jgi:hypothetical protein
MLIPSASIFPTQVVKLSWRLHEAFRLSRLIAIDVANRGKDGARNCLPFSQERL